MVFGKKIFTDVVNFLFYFSGKAVRRGSVRKEGNVKEWSGERCYCIAASKEANGTPTRKEGKNEIIGQRDSWP